MMPTPSSIMLDPSGGGPNSHPENMTHRDETIRQALLEGGSIAAAGRILSRKEEWVRARIAKSPDLQETLRQVRIQRPQTNSAVKQENFAVDLKDALKKTESILSVDGLKAIGIDEAEAIKVVQFGDLLKNHSRTIRDMTGGGLFQILLTFRAELEKTTTTIQELDSMLLDGDETRDDRISRLSMLRKDRIDLARYCLDVADRLRQSHLTNAMIELKGRELTEKKAKEVRKIPAFAPLAMRVNGNVTVMESGEANGNGHRRAINLEPDGGSAAGS